MTNSKKFFTSNKLRLVLAFLFNTAIVVLAWIFHYLWVYYIASILIACISIFFLANREEKDTYKVVVFLLVMALPIYGITYAVLKRERKGSTKTKKEWANILYRNRNTNLSSKQALLDLKNSSASAYKTCNYLVESIGMSCYDKTDIKYYGSGDRYFNDLFEACKSAKKYILIECYKIKPSKVWWSLFDILRFKSREGVKVKLVYDDSTCTKYISSEDFIKMRNHGIETVSFNKVKGLGGSIANSRNFKRLAVIDGEIGFMSGFNLSDEYLDLEEDITALPTKDCGIRFTGSAVRNLIVSFFEDYQYATRKVVKLQEYFADSTLGKGKNWILPYSTNPISVGHTNQNAILSLINNAKESVIITTTSVTLDDELQNALIMASKSGVGVKVVYSGATEKQKERILAKSYFSELIKEGIQIYELVDKKMTSRTLIVDGNSALISTNNLDFFSNYTHFNSGVFMYGEVVKEIQKDINEVISNAQALTLKDIQKRKFTEKISATYRKFTSLFK